MPIRYAPFETNATRNVEYCAASVQMTDTADPPSRSTLATSKAAPARGDVTHCLIRCSARHVRQPVGAGAVSAVSRCMRTLVPYGNVASIRVRNSTQSMGMRYRP